MEEQQKYEDEQERIIAHKKIEQEREKKMKEEATTIENKATTNVDPNISFLDNHETLLISFFTPEK